MDHFEIQRRLTELKAVAVERGYEIKPSVRIHFEGQCSTLGDFDLVIEIRGSDYIFVYAKAPEGLFDKGADAIRGLPHKWTIADVAATLGIEEKAA